MGLMEIVVSYRSFLARSLPVIDVILRLPLSLSCGWLFLVAVIVYVYVHYCKPFEYYLGAAGAGNKHQIGKCTHVVVTGGSQGIGLEVAKEYVRQGANVTIVARNVKTLASAVEILRACAKEKYPDPETGQGGGGGNIRPTIRSVSVDCASSENFVRRAFVDSQVPDCDILVNCAGTSVAGAFDELKDDAFENMLRVNVLGSVFPTRVLIGGMKKRGAGRVVFVASQVAQCALHGYTAYAASKWALRGLAEALQMELKPFGILVSVAYPPDTDTPGYKTEMLTKPSLTSKLSESSSVFKPEQVAKDIVKGVELGYFGISTGLDGWLLKQLHAGMSPVHNAWEVLCQVLFAPISRIIAVFYLVYFDSLVLSEKLESESEKSIWKTVPGSTAAAQEVGAAAASTSANDKKSK